MCPYMTMSVHAMVMWSRLFDYSVDETLGYMHTNSNFEAFEGGGGLFDFLYCLSIVREKL